MSIGGGGGGGDGGAAERKAAEDARVKAAIEKLNRTFGAGQAGETRAAPTREAFATQPGYWDGSGGSSDGDNGISSRYWVAPQAFDDGAYERELAAWQAEQGQSQAQIDAARQQRESLYGTIAKDSKALQLDDLGRERKMAQREVEFDLARRGLTGGSRQIDTGRELDDQWNRGVLAADNNAQSVANEARMADERTRVSLINSIRSGMDEADATSAAFNALQNNANQAATSARNQSVGGFFDAIRSSANQYQQADAYEKAFQKYRAGGAASGGEYDGSVRRV